MGRRKVSRGLPRRARLNIKSKDGIEKKKPAPQNNAKRASRGERIKPLTHKCFIISSLQEQSQFRSLSSSHFF